MAAKSGESKAAFVVPLVLFILLSIVLGVTTYTGYDAANQEKAKADEAAKKAQDADKLSDWYRYMTLGLRSYMGQPVKDEKGAEDKSALESLGTLRGQFESGAGHEKDAQKNQNAKLIQDLDKRYGWDKDARKPKRTMEDELAFVKGATKQAQQNYVQEKARADELTKQLTDTQTALKAAQDAYLAKMAETGKTVGDDKAVYEGRVRQAEEAADKVNKELNDLKQTVDAERQRMNQVVDDALKLANAMRRSSSDQMTQVRQELLPVVTKLETSLEKSAGKKLLPIQAQVKSVDRTAEAVEKGQVYRIDRSGEMPFLNLGRAHGLRVGQTFSIHGRGPDGRPLKESKGSVEVLRVIDDRLSQARVTRATDAGRDPIMAGDALVNPLWNPNQMMHVAVAGAIDLNGDGQGSREEIDEFTRTLRQQNIVVDAYLDLRDLRVIGQMTAQTDYLIEGLDPDAAYLPKKEEGDARAERAGKAATAITQMKDQAARDGIQIISLKNFLALTGYRVTKPLNVGGNGYQPPTNVGAAGPVERRDVPKGNGKR